MSLNYAQENTNKNLLLSKYTNDLTLGRPFLLISRLEYWFSKTRFREGFFKFLEPCGHRLYREGDSWAEEIGWKRDQFKRIFDEIGIRYGSKTAYVSAREKGDVFQGKAYAAYYDRKTNRTFFIRNHPVAEALRQTFAHKKTSQSNLSKKTNMASSSKDALLGKSLASSGGGEGASHKKLGPKDPPSLCSQAQYRSTPKTQSPIYSNNLTYSNISSLPQEREGSGTKPEAQKAPEEEDILKMIEIWEKTIAPLPGWQKMGSHLQRLKEAFLKLFQASLEKWQGYCRKIASSKFLMGEGSSFKAWILWAIKEETIARIDQGGFTLGDRSLPEDPQVKAQKIQEQHQLSQRFEGMAEEDKKAYVPLFLKDLWGKNPAMATVIQESGLKDSFHLLSFKTFVLTKLKEQEQTLCIA
jgi:hypothetical protein